MANLDDLDTTGIGIIAFWNAHDHRNVPGVGDVNPTDCISVFDSYSVYDNGIEGYKALGITGRYFHARVKTDGWMVAWIDRTNTFAYPNKPASDFGEAAYKGYYDILYDWFNEDANINSTYTTLSYLISLLYNALTNKADFNFAAADIGHYCYEFPDANVFTLISLGADYSTNKTGYVQYTTGTTLYYASVTGSGEAYNSGYSATVICQLAGNDILNYQLIDGKKYGAADIIANNWMPAPLTNYTLYCYGRSSWSGNPGQSHGCILIIWS